MVRVEDNICTYRYGEILHASAVLLKLFMSDRDYMSTGEDLHFLFRVCKWKVCPPTKRRKTNEVQVVGGPNSTGEGMNKINTGGKSRENCALQFWPAKLYQRGNISYTQR